MACGGVSSYEKFIEGSMPIEFHADPVRRLVNMSLEMMDYTSQCTFGNGEKIILKIGIHFGKVIASVIGGHKPQFSLIGDTVNTASRICTTGQDEKITLSDAAWNITSKNNISFIQRIIKVQLFFIKRIIFFVRQKEKEH